MRQGTKRSKLVSNHEKRMDRVKRPIIFGAQNTDLCCICKRQAMAHALKQRTTQLATTSKSELLNVEGEIIRTGQDYRISGVL